MITQTIQWHCDLGDDYLMRIAPMIKINAEDNWPKWYPTCVIGPRKMWAHTSTPQLKEIVRRYNED